MGDRVFDCPHCEVQIKQSENSDIRDEGDMKERGKQHLKTEHEGRLRESFEKQEPNAPGNTYNGYVGYIAAWSIKLEGESLDLDGFDSN
ncbi:hypothetical protein [Natrialba swarupiae]|uniref:Uncharacterized protein n=1 Tax=Natrialba swarupiae TaxID=2448032 RepID=A0A5D5AP61_9EURY|nr:hypothetical protein [Natrialba swarupiae]TYT62665.1 hypothetical protein FYC77_06425 [Natrialba swarupiae]